MSKPRKLAASSIPIFVAIAASSLIVNAAKAETQTAATVQASENISSVVSNSSTTAAQVTAPVLVSQNASPEVAVPQSTDSNVIRDINRDALGRPGANSAQVTSVSQLSDVKPTDWAFTALQSLVERYGCIAGFPDRTYKGQRATTRFEFAAGLNACLDKINEIISAGLADKVSKEDFAAVQKLQEEFAYELAALKGRVDAVEAKTAQLEAQQFSTTTKLNATAIMAVAGASGGDLFNPATRAFLGTGNTNVTFSGRVRLNFDTSFTGKDRLRTRLEAGNITRFDRAFPAPSGSARETRLGFDTNNDNTFQLTKLYYRFPVGNATIFAGTAIAIDDIYNTVNPYFESSDNGALSRFGRYDPLSFRGADTGSLAGNAGAGVSYKFNDQFTLTALYLADAARAGDANPAAQGGLTGGSYVAGAQLLFTPNNDLTISAVYSHMYQPGSLVDLTDATGSERASRPFGLNDTSADRYGGQFFWRIAKPVAIAGWATWLNATQQSGVLTGRNATLFTWAVNLAFPDLFAEGNVGGIIFGQNPKLTSISNGLPIDDTSAYTLEAQYRFRLSKNITITPGAYVIFNPGNYSGNSSIVVGTIRTTFSF